MKSIIVSLLFVALLAAAQSDPVSKIPNYYYDSNSQSFAYCTPYDRKPGCVCTPSVMYSNGICITLDGIEEHMCGQYEPEAVSVRSDKCSYFGSTVDYCTVTNSGNLEFVHTENCFDMEDVEYGVMAVFAKVSFTNMPLFGITAEAKAKIISGLVASFPFMISDVEFGSMYKNDGLDVYISPTTIIELRILTQKKYGSMFESAVDNDEETGPAAVMTEYLHTYADTIFSPAVEVSFDFVKTDMRDVSCTDESGNTYELGDAEYRECKSDTEKEYSFGYQRRTCQATNGGSWSDYSTSECIEKDAYADYQSVLADIIVSNIPYSLFNANITKAIYPLVIELAASDLRDIKIFNNHPVFTDDDVHKVNEQSASVSVLMLMTQECKDYLDTTIDCNDKIAASFETEETKQKLQRGLKDIDSAKFMNAEFDFIVHDLN